jgi:hypothetical protein
MGGDGRRQVLQLWGKEKRVRRGPAEEEKVAREKLTKGFEIRNNFSHWNFSQFGMDFELKFR